MRPKTFRLLAMGLFLSSALLFTAAPADSLCGTCGWSVGVMHCLSNPPDFADCRSWVERYWIEVPGECGTCPGRFIRVEESKCEASVPCSV